MIRLTTLFSALSAVVCFASSGLADAGPLDCGCSHQPAHVAPLIYSPPLADDSAASGVGCSCCVAATSCCGVAGVSGGLTGLGNLYGSTGLHGGHYFDGHHGSSGLNSFESGFENLPNMDGGGVHHRLPFHSYRRPWAHPGIAENNINIVW